MPSLTADSVLDRFRRVGALLEGHFRLTSGLHSSGYLQCALVLQHPREAEACGADDRRARASIAADSARASVKVLQAAARPSGVCQQALNADKRTSGAMPTIPTLLLATAAITPATAVP